MDYDLVFRSPLNPNSHFTAKRRENASLPTRVLFEKGCVVGRTLDFGCGLGEDVKYLRANGADVTGYDPYYCPIEPEGRYDTILCNYVLNVLLPEEQSTVLMAVSELLHPGGTAYFAVRRDVERSGYREHAVHGCEVYQCNVKLPYPSVFRNRHCEIYQYRHINTGYRGEPSVCDLCSPKADWQLLTESALAYSVWTTRCAMPEGCLVIPKRHVSDYFAMSPRLQFACWLVARRAIGLLYRRFGYAGCTLSFESRLVDQPPDDHVHIRIASSAEVTER